jgi:hypothetical protein
MRSAKVMRDLEMSSVVRVLDEIAGIAGGNDQACRPHNTRQPLRELVHLSDGILAASSKMPRRVAIELGKLGEGTIAEK